MVEASAIKGQDADYMDDSEKGKLGCCDDGANEEAENCCGKGLRCWLITANLVTLLVGLTEIIMGIMAQTMPQWSFAGDNIGWFIIITGLFLFLVSFLGVFAGCKGARADCWMYTYAIVLTIIFGIQIAAVVYTATSSGASNKALTFMDDTWNLYTTDANKQYMGLQLGCCSADSTLVIGEGDDAVDCKKRNDFEDNGEQKTRFLATCDVYPVCVELNGEDASADNSGCGKVAYVNNPTATCAVTGKWDADYGSGADDKCDAYKASPAMPSCTTPFTFDKVWYTTIAGASKEGEISLKEDKDGNEYGLNLAFVNCYGRIESFLAGNIMAAAIGIVIYILWQLLLVLFAWMLACDCCNKKGVNTEDSAVDKSYEQPV